LLDPCLRLTEKLSVLNAQPVIFKLLQALRLVIDGNVEAAVKVGRGAGIMAKFVEWGSADTQGLKAESARLIAAIVKHSKNTDIMASIVALGGLPHLTTMLMSSHVKMLHEAVVSNLHQLISISCS
jgi:hypothetical protein